MTSSSEPVLSFEQQELRKVSAKLDKIEAIQMAEIQKKDLNKEQTVFKAWAVQHENGLNTYKLKLEEKEQDYRDILKKPTEVYLFTFYLYTFTFFLTHVSRF